MLPTSGVLVAPVRPDPHRGALGAAAEIDVNCGVLRLLKDCNQDIVQRSNRRQRGWLWQAVGEVAIQLVTYETLPYLLTKPIKAPMVDPDGDLHWDQERRHPAHPRFLLPADLYAGEYRQLYGRRFAAGEKFGLYVCRKPPQCAVDRRRRRRVLLLVPAQADFRTAAERGAAAHSRALRGPGRGAVGCERGLRGLAHRTVRERRRARRRECRTGGAGTQGAEPELLFLRLRGVRFHPLVLQPRYRRRTL